MKPDCVLTAKQKPTPMQRANALAPLTSIQHHDAHQEREFIRDESADGGYPGESFYNPRHVQH